MCNKKNELESKQKVFKKKIELNFDVNYNRRYFIA